MRNCYKSKTAERRVHPQTNTTATMYPPCDRIGQVDAGQTRRVETVVVALILEYHQVKVRDGDGRLYALTRKTQGVELASLREGQRVVCTVTGEPSRVLSANAA